MSLLADLGQALDPLAGAPFGVVVLERVDQLAQQPRREVDPRHDHPGDLVVLDLVVDPGERDAELVVRMGDVREVRVVARHDLRGRLEVDVALAVVLGHPRLVSRTCGTSCSRWGGCARPSPTTWSTTAACWPARPASTSSSCARTSRSSAASPSAPTWCCSTAGARRTTPRGSRASSRSAGRAAATCASWWAARSAPRSGATTTCSRSAR